MHHEQRSFPAFTFLPIISGLKLGLVKCFLSLNKVSSEIWFLSKFISLLIKSLRSYIIAFAAFQSYFLLNKINTPSKTRSIIYGGLVYVLISIKGALSISLTAFSASIMAGITLFKSNYASSAIRFISSAYFLISYSSASTNYSFS